MNDLDACRIVIVVEPAKDVCTLSRIVGPARGHDPQRSPIQRLSVTRRMEDRRIDGVVDHDRLPQLDSELVMPLETPLRLKDGCVGDVVVDAADPQVAPVVETAVDRDGPVDAMHHARSVAGEAA